MNTEECLQHCLTEDERIKFEEDGYIIVNNALSSDAIEKFTEAVDNSETHHGGDGALGYHDRFLELVDWPTTFPKVFGILGWNIYVYYSQLLISPPLDPSKKDEKRDYYRFWHQDSGRINADIEPGPQPRLSLKVAYFLTDLTQENSGNFTIIPGSHKKRELDFPSDGFSDPEGAIALKFPAGTAVIFDRRLWHVGGPGNFSNITRKMFTMGYGYRWLRPRDRVDYSHYIENADPIRRQLLGVESGPKGTTVPMDEDVPLRDWMLEHLGKEAIEDKYIRLPNSWYGAPGVEFKYPATPRT